MTKSSDPLFLSHHHLSRMLLQHLIEIPTRVTGGMFSNLFWGARHHDLPSLVSPFWTEVHDPVGTADHIEVVLNHQDRVALVDESLHHIHQLVHIKEAEAGGGLVDQIKGFASGTLGKLGG